MIRRPLALVAAVLALALAAPAEAATVRKTVDFELDEWIDLSSSDGPVTLHRIQIAKGSGGPLDKSAFFRPGNSDFLQTVQIRYEYTNSGTRDWDAHVRVIWKDRSGDPIDGYNDEESLDAEERHEVGTITLSTLKYGLANARKVEIEITYEPE